MGKAELIEGLITAGAAAAVCALIGYFAGVKSQSAAGTTFPGPVASDDADSSVDAASASAVSAALGSSSSTAAAAGTRDVELLIGTADMLVQSGRLEEAEGQYLAALEVVSEAGGSSSALCALIHHELGALYKALDRLPESDRSFGESVRVFRKVVSENVTLAPAPNGSGASPIEPLCRSLCEQAEVKSLRTRLGAAEPNKEETAKLLDDAKALATEAVELLEGRFGKDPKEARERKQVADALRSLTQVLMFQKSWPAAEETIRRSIDLLLRSTYQTDPAVVTGRMWLSQILLGMERYSDAAAVCRTLAETHKDSAEEPYFLRYLGEVLTDCEEYAAAEDALTKALACYQRGEDGEGDADGEGSVAAGSNNRDRWTVVNDLAVLYGATGKNDLVAKALADMRSRMKCPAPETSSRYLRTLQCAIQPSREVNGRRPPPSAPHVVMINVLVRERHSKKLPPGSFLVFCFQPPGAPEPVPMGLVKEVEPDTKTVAVASPEFTDMRPGSVYTVMVRVLAKDHETVLSEHIQMVRFEPLPSSLVLD